MVVHAAVELPLYDTTESSCASGVDSLQEHVASFLEKRIVEKDAFISYVAMWTMALCIIEIVCLSLLLVYIAFFGLIDNFIASVLMLLPVTVGCLFIVCVSLLNTDDGFDLDTATADYPLIFAVSFYFSVILAVSCALIVGIEMAGIVLLSLYYCRLAILYVNLGVLGIGLALFMRSSSDCDGTIRRECELPLRFLASIIVSGSGATLWLWRRQRSLFIRTAGKAGMSPMAAFIYYLHLLSVVPLPTEFRGRSTLATVGHV